MQEVWIVATIFGLFPAILAWAIVASKRAKYSARGGEGEGLRASDLERIIRDAVEDATEPLVRRIETLEAIATDVDAEDRPGRLDPAVLADALDSDLDEEDEPAAVRRRTRS